MNESVVLELCRSVLITALTVAAPVLLVGMCVGLCVSLFQAVTSVHEQTMALIPKMFAVITTSLFLFPWIMTTLLDYSAKLFGNLAAYSQ